jgi:hypothetical protein
MSTSVKKPLMELPISPGQVFGPGVAAILDQTATVREDKETLQSLMGPLAPCHPTNLQYRPQLSLALTGCLGPPPNQP